MENPESPENHGVWSTGAISGRSNEKFLEVRRGRLRSNEVFFGKSRVRSNEEIFEVRSNEVIFGNRVRSILGKSAKSWRKV